ncbi:MAG TPA: hypothetical protein VIK02_09450 [Candidatus Anoxymicrobiaceae bacterium]
MKKSISVLFIMLMLLLCFVAASCGDGSGPFTGIYTDHETPATGATPGYVKGSGRLRIDLDGTYGFLFNWNQDGVTKEYSVDGKYTIKDSNKIYLEQGTGVLSDRWPSQSLQTMTLGKNGSIITLTTPSSTLDKVSNMSKNQI